MVHGANKRPAAGGRRGRQGRMAERQSARAAPHAPGPPEGGRFAPACAATLRAIHETALTLLAEVGLAEAPPAVVALVEGGGGRLSADRRLLFPPSLVERALAGLPRALTLHGRAGGADLRLEGKRVHVGSGGAAPFVIDPGAARYRPATLADLHDAARLVDALENIQFFSRSLVARDLEDPRTLDVNTAFAALAGTSKHVMVSASDAGSVDAIADLCAVVAGSEAAFRARPFLSLNVNHVAPPLRFAPEACEALLAAVRRGVPVHVNTFGQLGASSPVTVAGCVAQTVAETLAGMVVAWLADAEVRAVFGPRPMVTDLRTGAMAGGGGEQALLTALSVQMAQFYGLPNSTIAGATDSKIPDAQSGHEKCLSVTLAAQAGCNLITQACGMQAGLMGCSLDAYVIDNDMLGAILRSLAPVAIGAEALDAGAIAEVARGEGHFLGRPETLARMERDFLYPRIGDRRSPEAWEADGAPDIRVAAAAQARAILASDGPRHLDPETEAALRARFDIRLPTERTLTP